MNIFDTYKKKIQNLILDNYKSYNIDFEINFDGVVFEVPPQEFNFDLSSNVALVLAKKAKQSPVDLAKLIKESVEKNFNDFSEVAIAGPGFINFRFSSRIYQKLILEILKSGSSYGSNSKRKDSYNIEFVSANPTGPLHVGHCRGAILGDVISNILIFNKHDVSKEYYVNDYGNQIINFTKSIYFRAREILYKEKFPLKNTDLYPGDYLIDIARNIIENNKDLDFDKFKNISKELTSLSVSESLKLIKSNLESLGIIHDNFISETGIVHDKEVEKVIIKLKDKNLIYQGKIKAPAGENDDKWIEREQLLFKSTNFGDDKDRALQKSDKSWTYFASDVAYHNNKLDRNFDILINILGADHAGYIKRIT